MNNKSRTYNSTLNIFMGIFSKMATALLTFLSRKIFLMILPIEYLGINGLFVDVLSMLSLADLGMATAMAYSFYKPLAEKDEYKLSALIHFYKKLYDIIAITVAVLGLALVPFLNFIVRVDKNIPHLELYYLISLANTVISYLFIYKSSIITADQKGYIVAKYALWTNSLKMIVQIIVLYLTKSYLLYCGISVIATLINNLIVSYQANKNYPFILKSAELVPKEKQEIFKNIKSAFIYKAAMVANVGAGNILISIIVGTAAVGMYANYNVTVNNLYQISFILFSSITASLGNLVVLDSKQKRFEVFKVIQMMSFWLSGFLVFCLYFLMDDFIILWLGREYLLDNYTKIIILISFYLTIISLPTKSYREAVGMFKKIKYIVVATAVVNIVLSVIMGLKWGISGILLATVIAKLVTYMWYEPVILFRDFFGSKVSYLFKNYLMHFSLVAVCILIVQAVIPSRNISNWFEWIISGCIYALIINLIYLLYYIKSQELKTLKIKFVNMLSIKK